MRSIVALALTLLVSCTSVATRTDRERGLLADQLRARAGADLDAAVEARARELLARPLAREGAVLAALALDPKARATLAGLDVASARRVRAGWVRNPVLQLGLARFDGETDLDLDLLQPLAELLTLSARVERAEGELLAERARAARSLVQLVHAVQRDWVEAAVAQRGLGLARERLEAEEAATRLADELHRAGNVVEAVLTQSQLARAQARTRQEFAQAEAEVALEKLARNFGTSGAQLQLAREPEAPLPRSLPSDLASRVESASLDLQEARARVETAARAAGIARWEVLLERSSLGLTVRNEAGREGAGPTLALALPLFDDGSAAQAEARARFEVALADHAALEFALRERTRSAQLHFDASFERHRIARDELAPAASRRLDEVLRQYNAMQVGVFDVLAARRVELEAQEAQLDSERDLWLAALDVEELLAGSLPTTSASSNFTLTKQD